MSKRHWIRWVVLALAFVATITGGLFLFIFLKTAFSPPIRDRWYPIQIAKANLIYCNPGSGQRVLSVPPGSSVHAAALILAQFTGLNDARYYFLSQDPAAPQKIPETVAHRLPGGDWALDPDFANSTVSFEMAVNLPTRAISVTTPVVWTRGLKADGTWSKDSPLAGKGGYIAFLDGHMQWYPKLNAADPENSLVKYGTNIPTANISEALPPGAVILSATPRLAH